MDTIKNAVKALGLSINKNSPSILIGLGIGGFVGSIVLAVQATPKARMAMLELQGIWWETDFDREPPPRELVIKTTLPYYIPTIATATLSGIMIILGNRIHLRRSAALASMYSIAENSLRTYQQKVFDIAGDKKATEIRGEIDQDALDQHPVPEGHIHNEGGGTDLCFEMSTGRYFYSTAEKIRAAVNSFNHELMQENVKSINELFWEFGLPSVSLGDAMGWNVENGLVEVSIGARIATNGQPCLTVSYDEPRPQYLWSN